MTADEALREMRALHDEMRAGRGYASDMIPLCAAIEAELKGLRAENERLLERKCANCGMPPSVFLVKPLATEPTE